MRFEASVQIASHPADVFAVLSDYQQDPRWRRGILTMDPQPPGPARPGTTTGEVIRSLGITTRTPGRVTAVTDGELLSWRAGGARLAASGTRRAEPAGDGTRVTVTTELRLRGLWRALQPLLALVYQRQLRGDLARLKTLVERR